MEIVSKSRAAQIREVVAASNTALIDALYGYKRVGELLLEQKQECKHGEFEKWVRDNCPFGHDTAKNYMLLHKEWQTVEPLLCSPITAKGDLVPLLEPEPRILSLKDALGLIRQEKKKLKPAKEVGEEMPADPQLIEKLTSLLNSEDGFTVNVGAVKDEPQTLALPTSDSKDPKIAGLERSLMESTTLTATLEQEVANLLDDIELLKQEKAFLEQELEAQVKHYQSLLGAANANLSNLKTELVTKSNRIKELEASFAKSASLEVELNQWRSYSEYYVEGNEWFEVLGVSFYASPDVVKAAHKRLIRFWHPDTNRLPYALDISQKINKAFQDYQKYQKTKEVEEALWAEVKERVNQTTAPKRRTRK